ncbi:hypothetical protein OS493_004499 [Desmophyllum pertusum]|uniref:Uncharacterized protein n=1 Tax=Desmophyllum pertusum TaxID=174260 RepID=A0A9W9ZH67_9CNID|nr:hypothetical protein OS493_004499 [Desmophyllum pertusum]
MLQATTPCRQLNSEAIKSAALCYLTPVISGRCSIISAKCVCNVKDKVLPKAWSSICKKRDACDSAISDSSQVPSSTTQQWLDGNLTSVNKSLCPAISYWVALTTPNGAPASPISVHRALLNCGVEVTANQVQFQEGKESPAIKEVYKIFKDHKNKHMQDLVLSSYRHFYEQEARKVIGEDGKGLQKGEQARYAFSYKCEARAFVNTLATNEFFKPRLIREMRKVIELIADPYCELFRPLVIDYDLIESQPGHFLVAQRQVLREMMSSKKSKLDKYLQERFAPTTRPKNQIQNTFTKSFENSFSPEDQSSFCEDFLKLA